MIDLHTVLEKECVLVDPAVSDKESLLRALVGALAARGSVSDAERLFADVMAREKLAPTGLGEGCAVPHANSHAAAKSAIVVLMAGPPESMGSHLQIISKIARILHDPTFMAAAIAAKDSSELAEAFYSRGA
jgi:mannitol/fructose-specific phosphotransferase system IIA component (Ntr-type)